MNIDNHYDKLSISIMILTSKFINTEVDIIHLNNNLKEMGSVYPKLINR